MPTIYQLNTKLPFTDYRDRELFTLSWEDIGEIPDESDDSILEVLQDFPYGIYCSDVDGESQFFEYMKVDHFHVHVPIFWHQGEPRLSAYGLHFAEKEVMRLRNKRKRERYTGRVYGTKELMSIGGIGSRSNKQIKALTGKKGHVEIEFVGDMTPDELIRRIYEQLDYETKISRG